MFACIRVGAGGHSPRFCNRLVYSFEGDYVDDLRTGHGLMEWPDGTRYEGEWEGDLPDGRGVFAFSTGQVYEGSLKVRCV